MHRTLEDFREGRVGVDDAFEFLKGCLAGDKGACFLDYVRCMRAIEVAAEYTARGNLHPCLQGVITLDFFLWLGRDNNLAESIGLPHRNSLSVGTEE